MTWIHPTFLFLGFSAIAPIVLHWFFFKQPIQRQFFPTFRFLLSSRVQAIRRKKIQEWMILVLRIILLLLFSWIVARPLQRPTSVETVEKIAFLLDDSLSTSYRAHGTSTFQRMLAQALLLLEKIPGSVPIAIYFTRGDFIDFTLDRAFLKQTLSQIRPLTHSFSC
ncbi:MAG: BatA and WFA domain-containing protein, partial [Planctomycetota bacterium]